MEMPKLVAPDSKLALTPEQVQAAANDIRRFDRICRGPLHPDFKEAKDFFLARDGEGDRALAAEADRLGRLNPATGGPKCAAHFLNDVIVAGPWDGSQHDYKCPVCGQEGKYGAPVYTPEYCDALIAQQAAEKAAQQA